MAIEKEKTKKKVRKKIGQSRVEERDRDDAEEGMLKSLPSPRTKIGRKLCPEDTKKNLGGLGDGEKIDLRKRREQERTRIERPWFILGCREVSANWGKNEGGGELEAKNMPGRASRKKRGGTRSPGGGFQNRGFKKDVRKKRDKKGKLEWGPIRRSNDTTKKALNTL